MALTFFEPKQDSGNGDTPFLNEWLEQHPKNKKQTFLVKELIKVKSGKGYLVVTDDFTCFIWKNQALTKLLIEALEIWVNEAKHGYAVYVYLKNPNKQDFTLASDKDEPVTWFNSKNGFTTTELPPDLATDSETGKNPFL